MKMYSTISCMWKGSCIWVQQPGFSKYTWAVLFKTDAIVADCHPPRVCFSFFKHFRLRILATCSNLGLFAQQNLATGSMFSFSKKKQVGWDFSDHLAILALQENTLFLPLINAPPSDRFCRSMSRDNCLGWRNELPSIHLNLFIMLKDYNGWLAHL